MTNKEKFLWDLCLSGMEGKKQYFVDDKKIYWRRLVGEYRLVTSLGYTDYFLIIWDIVRWAKEQGIMVSPARGSVAASLLAFVAGITDVDPIRFDLMFERFLNPVRAKFDPPDIDLDFQASRRDEIKGYIIEKYGRDRVCDIGSHSRAYASGTIKDVAKVMDLDFHSLNAAIAHKLYDITLEDAFDTVDSFREWVSRSYEHERCYDIACRLEGLIRHRSVHPSGVVIAPGPIEDYVPIIKIKNTVATQWKDTHVGRSGILKIDILGLNTLDVLRNTMDLTNKEIGILDLPLEDVDTLGVFNDGETVGIFQFDAYHQRNIVKRLGVDGFDDIVLASAISRPGSSRTGIADSVIERKHGREKITYPHKLVEPILRDTYGYPIYQELVMKMAHVVGNIPLTDTEIMRDAIKHFKHDVMAQYRLRFIRGAGNNGVNRQTAGRMWEWIQGSSGYGFNKAHATAYSLISYWCSYLKTHYPLEFMTACLSNASGGSGKSIEMIGEARRLGIEVKPANINKSGVSFTIDGDSIIAGLTAIKYVGDKAAVHIIDNRPYRNLQHFEDAISGKQCNKRVVESLHKAGAFNNGTKPRDILEYYGCWMGDLNSLNLKEGLPQCQMCELRDNRFKVVTGYGDPDAEIMFVGEAPGHQENIRGKPFVGSSGKELTNNWLPRIGLDREEVYITNVVKCIPQDGSGKTFKPSDDQILLCSIWLDKEIEEVNPKIIVALGSTALRALSKETSITRCHGKTFDVVTKCMGGKPGILGFGLWHPAYALRQRQKASKKELDEALLALRDIIRSGGY